MVNIFLSISFLIIVILFCLHFFYLLYLKNQNLENKSYSSVYDYTNHKLNYPQISTNQSNILSFLISDLQEEILFTGKNSRPDANTSGLHMKLFFKSKKKHISLFSNKKIYICYSDKGLDFSVEKTPLYIKVDFDNNGDPIMITGLKLLSDSGNILIDEEGTFDMQVFDDKTFISQDLDEDFIKCCSFLRNAKLFGKDKLFSVYGGPKYLEFTDKDRLVLYKGMDKYIFYIKEGDYFIWKDNMWEKSSDTRSYHMAKVTCISNFDIKFDLWDKFGLNHDQIVLYKKETKNKIPRSLSNVFTSIKKRTMSRVQCFIGDKNKLSILKKGDWVIRNHDEWSVVKNKNDLESILNFKIDCELFVFDGLKENNGRTLFCGTFFDEMRNTSEFIELPLLFNKKNYHSKKLERN